MRKRIWISCIIVLVVCLLLILLRLTQHHNAIIPRPSMMPTNPPSQTVKVKAVRQQHVKNIQKMLTLPQNATPLAQAIAKTNPVAARVLADWQASINFYGKVVDESSNAVAGANITFHWVEIPTSEGNRTATAESDAEGLFSLQNKRGPSLEVVISKDGYYASHGGHWGFNYALGPDIISHDPQNPIVFYLRKKGTGENLIHVKQNYRVARDGTPLGINLTTGKTAAGNSGDMVVQCWTEDQGKRSGQKYDWRCVVTIPGGGAITNDNEFPFEAPVKGYLPSLEIAMPTDRPDWTSDVNLDFFYRLADGRYGRMTFSMIAGGDHFCMIDSLLNPTGSRDLALP